MFVLSISLCSKILYIPLSQTHGLTLYVLLSFIALIHYNKLFYIVKYFFQYQQNIFFNINRISILSLFSILKSRFYSLHSKTQTITLHIHHTYKHVLKIHNHQIKHHLLYLHQILQK